MAILLALFWAFSTMKIFPVVFSKLNANNLPSSLALESGTFQIPSFCNLTGQTNETRCKNQVLTKGISSCNFKVR